MILECTKTTTRRNWSKSCVIVGHDYPVKTKMISKETHCRIKVLNVYQQRLGEMNDLDANKEGYKNLEEFKQIWIEINGFWNQNMNVFVIDFEVKK